MRLRYRLSLMIGVASLVPLLFTGLAATQIADKQNLRQTRLLYAKQAQGLALTSATWLESQLRGLNLVASTYRLEEMETLEQEAFLRVIYRQFDAVNIAVLRDAAGLTLAGPTYTDEGGTLDSGWSSHQRVGRERLETFLESLPLEMETGPGLYVGEAYGPPDGAETVLVVRIPVPGELGMVLGVELSLASLQDHFVAQANQGTAAVLMGEGGDVLVGEPGQLVQAETVALFQGEVEGDLSYLLDNGTEVLAAFSSVSQAPWRVVVAIPRSVATQAGREILRRTWFMYALATVMVVGLGLYGARQISRPVIRLKDAALNVAEGQLGKRVEAEGSRELVELTRAFNFMSRRLAQDQKEIAEKNREISAFNEELQQRVEERTRELREAQQRLVESSRLAAVAQMGAGLAHELNNPVAGILGLAQLGRSAGDPVKLLAGIETQAQRCREILQALTRFTGEGPRAGREACDLCRLAADAAELVSPSFRDAGLTVEAWEAEAVPVVVDAPLLIQALAQLMKSMRSELEPGSSLRVSGRQQAEIALLEFELTGTIRPRGDDWLASGMGYWIARKVLEEHGGRLEEPHAGGESVYRVVLPLG